MGILLLNFNQLVFKIFSFKDHTPYLINMPINLSYSFNCKKFYSISNFTRFIAMHCAF